MFHVLYDIICYVICFCFICLYFDVLVFESMLASYFVECYVWSCVMFKERFTLCFKVVGELSNVEIDVLVFFRVC